MSFTITAQTDLVELNKALEKLEPADIVRWAVDTFGQKLCLTTSFSDTLLVDMAVSVSPDLEVVFLDTGFHFLETLATMRSATARYQLNLTMLHPSPTSPDLWVGDVGSCCGARKVDPLNRYLSANADAWLSGLRRDDSAARADTPVVEFDSRGLAKVNPLVVWSTQQLDEYAADNDVLVNPLREEGYGSIGCWPCTEPSSGDDERSGRWAGSERTECGIHDRWRSSNGGTLGLEAEVEH